VCRRGGLSEEVHSMTGHILWQVVLSVLSLALLVMPGVLANDVDLDESEKRDGSELV
jgi:hypothetical protein